MPASARKRLKSGRQAIDEFRATANREAFGEDLDLFGADGRIGVWDTQGSAARRSPTRLIRDLAKLGSTRRGRRQAHERLATTRGCRLARRSETTTLPADRSTLAMPETGQIECHAGLRTDDEHAIVLPADLRGRDAQSIGADEHASAAISRPTVAVDR